MWVYHSFTVKLGCSLPADGRVSLAVDSNASHFIFDRVLQWVRLTALHKKEQQDTDKDQDKDRDRSSEAAAAAASAAPGSGDGGAKMAMAGAGRVGSSRGDGDSPVSGVGEVGKTGTSGGSSTRDQLRHMRYTLITCISTVCAISSLRMPSATVYVQCLHHLPLHSDSPRSCTLHPAPCTLTFMFTWRCQHGNVSTCEQSCPDYDSMYRCPFEAYLPVLLPPLLAALEDRDPDVSRQVHVHTSSATSVSMYAHVQGMSVCMHFCIGNVSTCVYVCTCA